MLLFSGSAALYSCIIEATPPSAVRGAKGTGRGRGAIAGKACAKRFEGGVSAWKITAMAATIVRTVSSGPGMGARGEVLKCTAWKERTCVVWKVLVSASLVLGMHRDGKIYLRHY